jgi:hypothetical protein
VEAPLVGSRIRFGAGWAQVVGIGGANHLWLIPEGKNETVLVPRPNCTASGCAAIARRIQVAKRQSAWKDARFRIERRRSREPECIRPRRERRREQRPVPRRARRASAAQRDGPLPPDDEPEPDPAARLDGFAVASRRMHVHLCRPMGARKAAMA